MYCNDGAVTQEATTDMVKRGLSVDVVKDGATLLDQIKQCELVRRRNWETRFLKAELQGASPGI